MKLIRRFDATVRRGQMPAQVARGVPTDQDFADLRLRNEARAKELIAQLGTKYACHPANAPRRAS